jgi:hypothetical protein
MEILDELVVNAKSLQVAKRSEHLAPLRWISGPMFTSTDCKLLKVRRYTAEGYSLGEFIIRVTEHACHSKYHRTTLLERAYNLASS